MKRCLLLGGAFMILLGLNACVMSSVSQSSRTGVLHFSVDFPSEEAFRVQFIPRNTTQFTVEINGSGLKEEQSFLIKKSSPNKVFKAQLPMGLKEVVVKALGQNEDVLARGATRINIVAGKTAQATVELVPVELDKEVSQISSEVPAIEPTVVPVEQPSPVNLPPVPIVKLSEPDIQHTIILQQVFAPSEISIKKGERVEWINRTAQNILISREGLFPNKNLSFGQSFGYKFEDEGVYRFKLKNKNELLTIYVN